MALLSLSRQSFNVTVLPEFLRSACRTGVSINLPFPGQNLFACFRRLEPLRSVLDGIVYLLSIIGVCLRFL